MRLWSAGIGLAHLARAVAQAHHARRSAQDQRLDAREEIHAVIVVELLADVVGQLQVLALVVAHRHAGGTVGGDVGRHQVRIHVQPGRRRLAILPRLVLELRHPVQPAEARDAVEDPAQADMGVHRGLREQGAARRIYAAGQQRGGHLQRLGAQLCRVLEGGDRVQVHHAEQALVGVLQTPPIGEWRPGSCRWWGCRRAGCRRGRGAWGVNGAERGKREGRPSFLKKRSKKLLFPRLHHGPASQCQCAHLQD